MAECVACFPPHVMLVMAPVSCCNSLADRALASPPSLPPSLFLLGTKAQLHGNVDIIGNSFTSVAVYLASPGWFCQILWALLEGLLPCVSGPTENTVMSPHGGMQEGRAAEQEVVFYKLKLTRWIIQPIQCVLTLPLPRLPQPFTHLSAHHQPLARPRHMTRLWPFPWSNKNRERLGEEGRENFSSCVLPTTVSLRHGD